MTEGQFAMWLKQVSFIPNQNQKPRLTKSDIESFLARVNALSEQTRRNIGGKYGR